MSHAFFDHLRPVRRLAVTLAVVVVVLNLAHAPQHVLDDVLLLGAVLVVGGGLAAYVLAALRRAPRVLLVGDEPGLLDLAERWGESRHVTVVGAYVSTSGNRPHAPRVLGLPLVGTPQLLASYVVEQRVDVVMVAARTAAEPGAVRRLEWLLHGTGVTLLCAHAADHVAPHRLGWTTIGGTTLSVISAPTRVQRWVKAGLDRLVGAVLLVLAAPFLAVLGVLVRLDSRGPALFAQTRVGRDGREFTLYKLRTMVSGAEAAKAALLDLDEGNGMLFKIRNDPRVTRIGRFLRATSLDELPQLWNVVRGDMSLVGPRPALPDEVARYTDDERRRLVVKPGLTGPWQVSGRSALSREESVRLDTGYADNWHPAGDARILVRTIDAVLLRRGAF